MFVKLKPRPKNAHKGTSGRVLILAGSRGMAGASVLCALGAVRAGAGLVRIGIVKSQQIVVAKRAPLEVTSAALPEDAQGHLSSWVAVKKLISVFKPDVIAVGPGLGVTPAIKKIVQELAFRGRIKLVIDADGLNALAQMKPRKFSAPVVMTPHVGEAARLIGPGQREKSAKAIAEKFGAVCLLKGPGTLVTDGKKIYKNTTGNPGMASGGMGDVLTGIIAALWAGGMSGLEAAALGAFIHGLAGDLAVKKISERSLSASKLADYLPDAFLKI